MAKLKKPKIKNKELFEKIKAERYRSLVEEWLLTDKKLPRPKKQSNRDLLDHIAILIRHGSIDENWQPLFENNVFSIKGNVE